MKYARVQDTTFIRDLKTTAIIQTDPVVVRKHEMRMRELEKEQAREAEINNLKNDLKEIKNLLAELLRNKSTV